MKTLIITLLLLTPLTVLAEPEVINETRDGNLYERIFNVIAEDLNLSEADIKIVVSDFDDYSIRTYGITKRESKELFTVKIKEQVLSRENKIRVFIHEMVHVSQMYDRRLRSLPAAVWFEGELYANDVPYYDRPYEIEADKMERMLYAKYKNRL